MTTLLRLLRIGLHLASGLLQCALLFPRLTLAQRNVRIQRWSLRLLAIFGVRLEVRGALKGAGAGAVVCNHISWIDVFVLDAVQPCRFIAKSEVRNWPLIGTLSTRAGTLYVDRQSRFGLRASNHALALRLCEGERLAFFPEGTSNSQGTLLPFHANLFAGVIEANAPVLPVAISYHGADGAVSDAADYIGDMSLGQSILRLLRAGGVTARVQLLAPLDSSGQARRQLAARAQAHIAAALRQHSLAPIAEGQL